MLLAEPLATIFEAFQGKIVGGNKMKRCVVEAVALLPEETIDFVTKNCWFMSSMDDAWAFTFTGNDLKEQHLIFLSDELFEESQEQIFYTIVHEIGHVILDHKNATVTHQSKEEITQQEKEADAFAKQYLTKPNPY